jgi:hypothetical protein
MIPQTKRFLWSVAWVCILSWAAWVGVIALRMRGATEGAIPSWLGLDSPLTLTVNAISGIAMLLCWFGSIYAWARSARRGVMHGLILPALVLFGVFVGAFYILASVRTIPEVRRDAAAA